MSPWWTTLHFMMQAIVVLLIHLAVDVVPVRSEQAQGKGFGTAHLLNPSEHVLNGCKKILHWLHHMASIDLSCKRGFEICHHLLYRIASPKGLDLEGVPSPSPLKQDPLTGPLFPAVQPTSVSEDSNYVGDNPSFAVRYLAMGGDSSEVSPLSLLSESDTGWFLSMEEFDPIHVPDDDTPGSI